MAERDLASLRQAWDARACACVSPVQVLLAGADVNARDTDGHTALMVACAIGDPRLAVLLIRHASTRAALQLTDTGMGLMFAPPQPPGAAHSTLPMCACIPRAVHHHSQPSNAELVAVLLAQDAVSAGKA